MQRRNCIWGESIDPKGFDESETLSKVPKSMEEEDRIWKSLKNIFLFNGLSEEELDKLVGLMQRVEVEAGETVTREGEAGEELLVVERGLFEAVRRAEAGERLLVHTYRPGEHFGELALMYDVPREATVTALTTGSLWALHRYSFKKTVLGSAHRKWELLEGLLSRVPLLGKLTATERARLAECLVEVSYSDGDRVFGEGDHADSMFFVLSGRVRLDRAISEYPEEEAKFVEAGEFFGEASLVACEPRTMSARAEGRTRLAWLEVAAFERLLGPCLGILEARCPNHKELLARVGGLASSSQARRK